jgi:hypothetical protein
MLNRLPIIVRWIILIIIAAFVFYLLYPKYYFIAPAIRGNKITGRVERFHEGRWRNIEELRATLGKDGDYYTPEKPKSFRELRKEHQR